MLVSHRVEDAGVDEESVLRRYGNADGSRRRRQGGAKPQSEDALRAAPAGPPPRDNNARRSRLAAESSRGRRGQGAYRRELQKDRAGRQEPASGTKANPGRERRGDNHGPHSGPPHRGRRRRSRRKAGFARRARPGHAAQAGRSRPRREAVGPTARCPGWAGARTAPYRAATSPEGCGETRRAEGVLFRDRRARGIHAPDGSLFFSEEGLPFGCSPLQFLHVFLHPVLSQFLRFQCDDPATVRAYPPPRMLVLAIANLAAPQRLLPRPVSRSCVLPRHSRVLQLPEEARPPHAVRWPRQSRRNGPYGVFGVRPVVSLTGCGTMEVERRMGFSESWGARMADGWAWAEAGLEPAPAGMRRAERPCGGCRWPAGCQAIRPFAVGRRGRAGCRAAPGCTGTRRANGLPSKPKEKGQRTGRDRVNPHR